MIRDSIEIGTLVFHRIYGFGTFQKFNSDKKCVVKFDDEYPIIVLRKDLNEVEE